jgi:hypothetical protein
MAVTAGSVLAAPPPKPPPAPIAADIAYVSISNSAPSGGWLAAAIRGTRLDSAGALLGDAEIWKTAERYASAITWTSDGQSLVWSQTIDKRGTRAVMIGKPGEAPRAVLTFASSASTGLRPSNLQDALVSGPGCGSTPVLYLWAVTAPIYRPTLWVVDPFAASPQPRELHRGDEAPPDDVGGTLHGLAISPLGRQLVFGGYSSTIGGRAALALPLSCSSASALPEAAGPAQPLFLAQYDADKAWIQSFDWSSDGHRLAVSMGRWVREPDGSLWQYDPELWVAELNYSSNLGSEQVSLAALTHAAASVVSFPSWAPSVDTASCDRLAFSRNGGLWLFDVPRQGFQSTDCSIGAPSSVGGVSAAALDWK